MRDDNSSGDESQTPISSDKGKRQRGRPKKRNSIGGRGHTKVQTQYKLMSWAQCQTFAPQALPQVVDNNVQQPAADTQDHRNWTPLDYFKQYFDNDMYALIAEATNQNAVVQTGHSLQTTSEEIRKFFAINIMMGSLRYPRIRMYWQRSTGVMAIKQAMRRDRFFKLRTHIKVVVDINVPEDAKQQDKLWKVRPLLDKIRETCLKRHRPSNCCVDEQMIPFTGRVAFRQYVRGKPNPTGLKNFVLASPSGEVLDFEIFQGKGSLTPDAKTPKLSVGGLAVLRLIQTVPANTTLFVDRFFTSLPLQDILVKKGITITGTIMKKTIPKKAKKVLKSGAELLKEGRGATNQIVREDQKVCIVQWFDNKEVLMSSNEFGAVPQDTCKRWSKKDKAYIDVQRPALIKQYNEKMGGVDLSDRMISFYRICARTKKWTVRTILHMIDLSLANSWVQERQDRLGEGKTKKELMEFLDFRISISENLLYEEDISDDEDGNGLNQDDVPGGEPPAKRIALPPEVARRHRAAHMPRMVDLRNAARCRNPACKTGKSRVMCTTCKVFLCIHGCFEAFHK